MSTSTVLTYAPYGIGANNEVKTSNTESLKNALFVKTVTTLNETDGSVARSTETISGQKFMKAVPFLDGFLNSCPVSQYHILMAISESIWGPIDIDNLQDLDSATQFRKFQDMTKDYTINNYALWLCGQLITAVKYEHTVHARTSFVAKWVMSAIYQRCVDSKSVEQVEKGDDSVFSALRAVEAVMQSVVGWFDVQAKENDLLQSEMFKWISLELHGMLDNIAASLECHQFCKTIRPSDFWPLFSKNGNAQAIIDRASRKELLTDELINESQNTAEFHHFVMLWLIIDDEGSFSRLATVEQQKEIDAAFNVNDSRRCLMDLKHFVTRNRVRRPRRFAKQMEKYELVEEWLIRLCK